MLSSAAGAEKDDLVDRTPPLALSASTIADLLFFLSANAKGVTRSQLYKLHCAPRDSKVVTHSSRLLATARCRAVLPFLSTASRLNPRSASTGRRCACPLYAALCTALLPSLPQMLKSRPGESTRRRRHSRLPNVQALMSGFAPDESFMLITNLSSTSSSAPKVSVSRRYLSKTRFVSEASPSEQAVRSSSLSRL